MIIDAHHHYWSPARGDYGWLPDDDPVLSRPYLPRDLAPELSAQGLSGTILVQAAPTVAETEYLLGLADATDHVAGVIGWIDFEDRASARTLERLAKHPKFKGVRPMIQDLPDDRWMLRDDVAWAYHALVDLDLTFDGLGLPRHIPHFIELLDRHPDLRAVLDHCLKPQLRSHSAESHAAWCSGLTRLSQTQAALKLSGLVTEADVLPGVSDLRPYTDHALAAFGPDRIMWGSDWPVVRLRCEYGHWLDMARQLTADLDARSRQSIFHDTAAAFYRLD